VKEDPSVLQDIHKDTKIELMELNSKLHNSSPVSTHKLYAGMRLIDDNCGIDHFTPLHLSFRLGSVFVKVNCTFKVVKCEGNLANR